MLNRIKAAHVAGVTAVIASTGASAAVPTALTTAYDAVAADFTDVFELAIPGLVIVSGSMLLWKYGKAFIRGL